MPASQRASRIQSITAGLVRDLPILRLLPDRERELLVGSFEPARFAFGDVIVREGDPADALYVITSGRAQVVKAGADGQEVPLTQLRPGESFGEAALFEGGTRTATVRASGDVEVLRLDRSAIDALLQHRPEIRQYLDLQAHHRHLENFFRLHTPFADLPRDGLERLLAGLAPVEVADGALVVAEHDPPGPMYIVQEGRLRVFRTVEGRRRYLAYLRSGDVFGEMSVFTGAPRAASVEAVGPCQLLSLSDATFRQLLDEQPAFREQIAARIAQYDYQRVARVPPDFAVENLPAAAYVEATGEYQVDFDARPEVEPTAHAPGRERRGATYDRRSEARPAAGPAPGPTSEPSRASSTPDEGRFVKRGGRVRRIEFVAQIDEMDCGAACLTMICRHFGRRVSRSRIRALARTSVDGTSLRGLCRAAQELGLAARSVKALPSQLDAMPLPAVVHWENYHWVVLYDVSATHVRLADPERGLRRITRGEFEASWSGYAALFDYTVEFEKAPLAASGGGWLLPFFRPYGGIFARAMGLAALASALQLAMPVFTQVIVDRVVVDQDAGLLNLLIVGMLVVVVFMGLAVLLQRYLLSFAAVRIDSATLDYLTQRLLALPMSYFNTRRTGDMQRRLAGMQQVREFLVQHGVVVLASSVQLVTVLVLMAVYSPRLTGVFLLTVPVYLLLMRYSARVLRPLFDDMEVANGRYASFQVDAIRGIETVKALGAENAFRELMLNQFVRVARKRFRADFTMMSYDGTLHLVTVVSVVLFLWVGAGQVMRGELTIGALVAFNALIAMANVPILSLLGAWDRLQMTSVLLSRLEDVFDHEPEQGHDRSRLLPVPALAGRIALRNLGFRYGGPDAPAILEGVSFEVEPNTSVAIVGRSGSGKTTLIKCLAGLLEPTEGTILYDGLELRTLNYRDLRRNIGFVLQENHLFSDTIARNIAFGEDEPDMDRVLWAARAASAHEFVERLPLGYDTPVGESGLAVSGGQRQRIAIARALYQRPPVLIFDEATSALDTESERAVKENIAQLLEGRTSFVIAHRLSTVRDADLILVLEKGKLVERGTHEELMAQQGLYFYLCSQQLGVA